MLQLVFGVKRQRLGHLVAALVERCVRRVPMVKGTLGPQEVLLQEMGECICDARAGPDGAVDLLTDSSAGRVLLLVPGLP